MKPRRWYSSPEPDPNPAAPARPFPSPVYWAFTTRTRPEQGPIIKRDLSAPETAGRAARSRLRPPRLRLIDAA